MVAALPRVQWLIPCPWTLILQYFEKGIFTFFDHLNEKTDPASDVQVSYDEGLTFKGVSLSLNQGSHTSM